jgi:hypothetical protein
LKWFDVAGCDSGKRYRIRYGSVTNVHEIERWAPNRRLVFRAIRTQVAGGVMLAQFLFFYNLRKAVGRTQHHL